ncbi:MAG TPA: hypothetical protein PLM53_15690 [Spirochaetota bacterium]|nr:hypothetical protein [Spirochaetota bacterium]HPC40010.1 hypothetical protein [Spirochaetota bacterium]HPL15179.1 hypothetical protein [Spirochaetota bacterium]HQF09889.1 hypothetical protein [Spirochaetota bacterium]HQH98540.1 hypothetical protein [Spirochaetota bacterium]
MAEKFSIQIKRFNIDFDVPLIWFTYFPFIGWIYPFAFRRGDAFAMHHGKQAFIMALFFTALPILLTFSTVFVPISFRVLKLIIVILIYLSHGAYFALCALGFMKVMGLEKYDFPFIIQYAKKINV